MVTNNRHDRDGWYGWWRVSRKPSTGVPLGGRSVGRADVERGWCHPTGQIHWINLYWGISGRVELLIDGDKCRIDPGSILFHPPGSKLAGIPISEPASYRWLTIDGIHAEKIIESLEFKFLVNYSVGRCPVEVFDQLELAIQDVSRSGEYRGSTFVYEILALAAAGKEIATGLNTEKALADRAKQLIGKQFTNDQFNVDFLASELAVHRSRLSRIFRKKNGVAPSVYIQRLRLHRAIQLLRNTQMTIKEVAISCGFADPAYFSRTIVREMGISPKKLRETL